MENIFVQAAKNDVLASAFFGWFIAQTLKVILGVLNEKRFNFKWFVGTGGMPSSHAALVAALTTAIAFRSGIGSPLFAATLVFAVIVVFDAQGVRRASGQQAETLNKILDDIYWKKKIPEDRLKEFLGHTPVEVIVGTTLGIVIAYLYYAYF
ncbi:MAG: divergent PAP2 family protein [Candidatus Omnitrophica bacterium]|nr:divergent PAP2 family protein [Candidatus Omnitrophota bacterium]